MGPFYLQQCENNVYNTDSIGDAKDQEVTDEGIFVVLRQEIDEDNI